VKRKIFFLRAVNTFRFISRLQLSECEHSGGFFSLINLEAGELR
jgi:hypothetical protein